jgi:hypothetical protein
MVSHDLCPVLQPPVVGPQGLDKGIEGVVLVPIPVTLGAQPVKAVVLLLGPTLQFLSPADKAREERSQGKREHGRDERGRNSKTQLKKHVPGRHAT